MIDDSMVLCCTGVKWGSKVPTDTQEQRKKGKSPKLRYLSARRSASCTSRDGKPPWLTVETEKIPGCGQGGWHWAVRAHRLAFAAEEVCWGRENQDCWGALHLPAEALGVTWVKQSPVPSHSSPMCPHPVECVVKWNKGRRADEAEPPLASC